MYLNADLDAIYERVLHFLWVLMIEKINFDILVYCWPKRFSVLHTEPQKNAIWLPKSGAKKGHFVSLPYNGLPYSQIVAKINDAGFKQIKK